MSEEIKAEVAQLRAEFDALKAEIAKKDEALRRAAELLNKAFELWHAFELRNATVQRVSRQQARSIWPWPFN